MLLNDIHSLSMRTGFEILRPENIVAAREVIPVLTNEPAASSDMLNNTVAPTDAVDSI